MSIRFIAASAATVTLSLSFASSAFAVTELQWWHAMAGANNEVVNQLSKEFNDSQKDYKIVPVFKGTYPEALNAGIAAFRAKQAPAILQVFDAGSGVMMGAEGAIMPAAQVLEKGGFKFDKSSELNANAKDDHDHPFGVWTLPPERRSDLAGSPPNTAFDHAPYDAVGESDRMTLRFVKPGP